MNKDNLTLDMLLFAVGFVVWVLIPSITFLGILPLLAFLLHFLTIALGISHTAFLSYWSYVLAGIVGLFGFIAIWVISFTIGKLISK
jgi:hypothetical protein